jgi:hypothetical protein
MSVSVRRFGAGAARTTDEARTEGAALQARRAGGRQRQPSRPRCRRHGLRCRTRHVASQHCAQGQGQEQNQHHNHDGQGPTSARGCGVCAWRTGRERARVRRRAEGIGMARRGRSAPRHAQEHRATDRRFVRSTYGRERRGPPQGNRGLQRPQLKRGLVHRTRRLRRPPVERARVSVVRATGTRRPHRTRPCA